MIRNYIVKQIALERMTIKKGNAIIKIVNEVKSTAMLVALAIGAGAWCILAPVLLG